MDLKDIDHLKNEFDEDEMDAMIDLLQKAEEIKRDGPLFKMLQARMRKKVKEITSLDDLRSKANELDMESD